MDKIIKKKMKALFLTIMDEAERNKEFADTISGIFEDFSERGNDQTANSGKRGANRRDKAILDPIKLAEEGSLAKELLEPLSEKELKDIIADYGMDPSKLAMKWKDRDRIIRLIIDISMRRASKGDAFRG